MEVLERGNLFFMIILEYVSLVSRNININGSVFTHFSEATKYYILASKK